MKYLFDGWNTVKAKIENKYLFIFLDFDGTLAPIAKTPDKARLPLKSRELLRRLARSPRLKIAFISGRPIEDIKDKAGLKGVIYSGNHGLQIEGPKIRFTPIVPPRHGVIIRRIKSDLEHKISRIKGSLLEDKSLSLSLHYRRVDKNKISLLKGIFNEAVMPYLARNKIKVKQGKMVLEVGPPLDWDKGKAVLWLLGRKVFVQGREPVLSVYIGDDVTDEDAFRALKVKGLTVSVGRKKSSCANYYLKNRGEVVEFLRRISEIYS